MRSSQAGQGLVEYSLIIVLIAIVVIVALYFLGPVVGNVFSGIGDALRGIDTPMVTPPSSPDSTVHISRLSMSVDRILLGILGRGRATITIVDQDNRPVAGAVVSGQWSGLASGSNSATTNGSGVAVITSAWTWTHGAFVFSVQGVSATGYDYDPASNSASGGSAVW